LKPELRAADIAGDQRYDGRKVAAGAVPVNADPAVIDAKASGIRVNPLERGKGIIHGRRKFVLRSHPVVDQSDDRGGSTAEVAGNKIMRIEAADDVAAAVEIDDGRHRRVASGQ
jgi:hypothetical protein